jgi:glycosyltransferase involved in cell wall biosynthesis
MPGLAGLGVLDSFALGAPLVATAYPYHRPEIGYLRDGINGIMVKDWESTDAYASAVISLLVNHDVRGRMAAEARKAAGLYTIETMALNFAEGVQDALQRNTQLQANH